MFLIECFEKFLPPNPTHFRAIFKFPVLSDFRNRKYSKCQRKHKESLIIGQLKKSAIKIYRGIGNSPVVQWSGLHTFHCQDLDSIPGWGTKILQATQCGQKKKDKQLLL